MLVVRWPLHELLSAREARELAEPQLNAAILTDRRVVDYGPPAWRITHATDGDHQARPDEPQFDDVVEARLAVTLKEDA